MRIPEFEPRSDWKPPRLVDLPSWREAKRVAVDVETRDLELKRLGPGIRRGGYVVGYSFAIEDGPAAYVPIAHTGGGNVDKDHAWQYLRDQAAVFRGPGTSLVGANISYDADYIEEQGVKFEPEFWRDVQVAEPLIDELQFTYNLDDVLERYGLPGKDESHLRRAAAAWGVHPKGGLHWLNSKHVGAYAEGDVRSPLVLLRRQEKILEERGLWDMYDLESRLLPVLLKMRRRGVRVNFDQLDKVEEWSFREEMDALAGIKSHTGIQLLAEDTNKASALAPALVEIGFKLPKDAADMWNLIEKGEKVIPMTAKTRKPSIKAEWLATIDHPVAALIRRARKFNKLRNTFCKSRREHAIGDRIYPTFNQLRTSREDGDEKGAKFGRLSSSNPNVQQEPARDPEIGPAWRSIYVPDEGGEWCCLDYSQQEPRWAVHFAEQLEKSMRREAEKGGRPFTPIGASDAADRYRNDPSADSHDMFTEMVNPDWPNIVDEKAKKDERDRMKQVFLGLIYGMGPGKLCRSIGLPTTMVWSRRLQREIEVAGPEGQAILDKFAERLPWLKATVDSAEMVAQTRGYVKTVLGRHCHFPLSQDPWEKYGFTYKAFNRVIQGSSGDQMKQAIVDMDAADARLQLTVHDECDFTIWNRQEAYDLAHIMLDAVPCNVPHRIDIEVGPNWGQLKSIDK